MVQTTDYPEDKHGRHTAESATMIMLTTARTTGDDREHDRVDDGDAWRRIERAITTVTQPSGDRR